MDTERLIKAEQEFQKLIQTQPDSPAGYMGMIQVASLQRDWKQALRLWDICLTRFPSLVLPHGLLAKLRVLLSLEDIEGAEELCRELQDTHPNYFGGIYGMVLVAEAKRDWREAERLLEICLEKFPGVMDGEWQAEKAGTLIRQNRLDEAERLLDEVIRRYPGCPEGYLSSAVLADKKHDLMLSRERWEKAGRLFPGHKEIQLGYIGSVRERGDFDQAYSLCVQGFENTGDVDYQLSLVECCVYQHRFEQALDEVYQLLKAQPENLLFRLKECSVLIGHWEQARLAEAVTKLERLLEEYPDSLRVRRQLGLAYIHNKENKKALELMESFSSDLEEREELLALYAWCDYQRGELEQARRNYASLLSVKYHAAVHAPCSLKRLDAGAISPEKDEIFLFSTIKDALKYLPWFLDYYRKLGVHRFFVIDNDSSDGTTDFLLQQPDVHLFWTDELFSLASSGMRWINELIGRYGRGHWCIFADCDEALVFPGMESGGLTYLLDYMESKGHEAMSGYMLDMYPESGAEMERYRSGGDLVSHSPYFDDSQRFFGGAKSPYVLVRGGARRRLFDEETWLEKVPIIRGGGEIKYLTNHHITPAKISDITGVFLHFALTQKFESVASASDIAKHDRFKNMSVYCKNRYSRYQQTFEGLEKSGSFLCQDSEKYVDSDQLVDLGLMHRPADYLS